MVFLNVLLIILSIALVAVILMQSRSAGMSAAFGGGEGFNVRRGSEKRIFQVTVVVAAAFLITAFLHLFL